MSRIVDSACPFWYWSHEACRTSCGSCLPLTAELMFVSMSLLSISFRLFNLNSETKVMGYSLLIN